MNSWITGAKLFIQMSYCEDGNLEDFLAKQKQDSMAWATKIDLSIQLATAVEYCHSRNFIHRDLKVKLVSHHLNIFLAE